MERSSTLYTITLFTGEKDITFHLSFFLSKFWQKKKDYEKRKNWKLITNCTQNYSSVTQLTVGERDIILYISFLSKLYREENKWKEELKDDQLYTQTYLSKTQFISRKNERCQFLSKFWKEKKLIDRGKELKRTDRSPSIIHKLIH